MGMIVRWSCWGLVSSISARGVVNVWIIIYWEMAVVEGGVG